MIIKKANCLCLFFHISDAKLGCLEKTNVLRELDSQSTAVEVFPHKGQADQHFTPLYHPLLSARAIYTDREGCGSLLCTENFNPGNFITSSRHNTIS